MVVAYDSLRFLPDELLLLIFNRLSRGDQARAARCSRYLYWRFLPLIWSTVNLRVSWSQAKRICSTIRRNECIGPLVQHFDLSPDAALTGAWADPLVILPVLVSTMSKLVNLRVLVFHFGTKLRPGMLQQCNFQRLESLKMALTTDNVDFVANHPSITALDPVLRSSWDVARRLGHGAQLAYVSVDGALLVDMLKNGAGRRLAPGCYVRLDDAFWADQAHSLCAALGASDVRIGLLHLNSHMFIHRRIPAGVTTDKIDGLRVPFLRRHAVRSAPVCGHFATDASDSTNATMALAT